MAAEKEKLEQFKSNGTTKIGKAEEDEKHIQIFEKQVLFHIN